MLATITGNAMIAIDTDEAAKLAQAAQRVARHYDVPGMSQQTIDWIGLIQTVGAIYGSRIMAARLERAAERAARAAQTPAPKVEPIRPTNQAATNNTGNGAAPAEIPGLGSVVVEMPGGFKQ